MRERAAALLFAAAACAAPLGCKASGQVIDKMLPGKSEPAPLTEDELRASLSHFAGGFVSALRIAAARVTNSTDDPAVHRQMIQFQSAVLPEVRRAQFRDDPRAAFLDLWTLIERLRFAVADPTLIPLAPEHQQEIQAALDGVETSIRAIGHQFLDDKALAEAEANIEAFAKDPANRSVDASVSLSETLGSVLKIPLAPFRAFEGIDHTAEAVRRVARTADEFNAIVDLMPEEMRWQTQLLLYDLEQRPTTVEAMARLSEISASAERLTQAAEQMPADARAVLDEALAGVERQNAELQALLESTRATLADVERTIASTEPLVAGLERSAASVAEAGAAWEGTFAALRDITGKADERVDDPDDKPFDITEYGAVAREVTKASADLRETLLATNDILASREIDSGIARTVDHVFVRALQFVAIVIGALILYRLVAARIPRRRAG